MLVPGLTRAIDEKFWLIYLVKRKAFSWSQSYPCLGSFLRRSFSDSCFLSSPLCSELADVQWYGHDKAKPGTLVWDLPVGPRKVPSPSPTASPLSLTTTHRQPTTSSSRPYKTPALTGRRTRPERPSSLHPALHPSQHLFIIPLHNSSAGQGHTRWAPIKADFTGQTEKCHLSCWTVALQHPFFTHPQHTSNGAMGGGVVEGEHRKNIKHITSTQRNEHQPFQDLFHISSLVLSNSNALPPNQRIPAGFEPPVKKQFPGPDELCWISLFPLMFVLFLFFSPCIFKKDDTDFTWKKIWFNKRLDDKFNSSQF